MKKYLFGFIAVLFIAASSFTIVDKTEKATTEYYFFEVISGQVDTGSPLNDEPMTIAEFQAFNPVSCPSGNTADCIRAWEVGHTPTTTGLGDYTIRKQ